MTVSLLTLAILSCTARYGTGTTALTWYRTQCTDRLYACLMEPRMDAKACVDKSSTEKICDPSGSNCF